MTYDLENAWRLNHAIHNHIPCGNPTCCPPKDQPVLTNPNPALNALKLIAAIYIPAVLLTLGLLLALGKVFG